MLIKLFFTFLKIGFLSLGGAYSFLPLLQKEIVESNKWVSNDEILDIIALSEVIPGALSIKFATYVGYKVYGIPGVIVSNLGNLLPPFFLILFLSHLYFKFRDIYWIKKSFVIINFVMAALIISSVLKMVMNNSIQVNTLSIIGVLFLGLFFTFFIKLHPAYIIIISLISGLIISRFFYY